MIHPSANVHPSAIISDKATLYENVKIGPYCIIGDHVVLHEGVECISHVSIEGRTTIGAFTKIYPFASIGHPPQDLKYNGEPSIVSIGSHTTIREYVTIQPGTKTGCMATVVKDHCLLMAGSHVAHDCTVGNHVIMANYATLAGHVTVEDYVIIGGLSAIQQFVRVGAHAIVGGMSGVEKDVIPYGLVMGERAHLHGLNLVGLKRRGFPTPLIQKLQNIYEHLFVNDTSLPFHERVQNQAQHYEGEDVNEIQSLFKFIESDSKRHFCMPKK